MAEQKEELIEDLMAFKDMVAAEKSKPLVEKDFV